MDFRRGTSTVRLPQIPRPEEDAVSETDKQVTVGVPLVKLIKRRLKPSPELVMLSRGHSVAAERFHRLKTTLVNDQEQKIQVMVVTSAGPGEGKSLVSMNLALAFAAESSGEVLLIDADLRRPGIKRWLEPAPKFGMTELLAGQIELDHALIELENTSLKILPAGSPTRDPVDLLSSDRAEPLFNELRGRFRRVIVDTPPIVPFTDADVVGTHADGLLLVSRADVTQKAMFERAVNSVTSTRIIGAVLNDAQYNLADRSYYQGSYYYGYYEKDRES